MTSAGGDGAEECFFERAPDRAVAGTIDNAEFYDLVLQQPQGPAWNKAASTLPKINNAEVELGENTTRRGQKHPLDPFGLKLEQCRASQRHRDELGDNEIPKPMPPR